MGSKEGWTPSNFVSSRSSRTKDAGEAPKQRPEDFMDEEDLADAEETKLLKTKDDFSGLGSTQVEIARRATVMDLLGTSGDTKGLQLLRKMGWRDGQGIGPKVRRKANLDADDAADDTGETYLFAPPDSSMIQLKRKDDFKGLGCQGEAKLEDSSAHSQLQPTRESDEENDLSSLPAKQQKKAEQRGGFGVGILNDIGSDEEDPYAMGPKISYNKTVGSDKRKKKRDSVKKPTSNANPLLKSAPVFMAKKGSKLAGGFRKCHDGRLPLNGFVLAPGPAAQTGAKHAPLTVPDFWKSTRALAATVSDARYQSNAERAKASSHGPISRAALLGEEALPGKSVFDFLKPSARRRMVELTKNESLPEAGSEAGSSEEANTVAAIPELDPQVAATALGRGVAGFVPYSDNLVKLSRYRAFLSYRAGLSAESLEVPAKMRRDEWVKELQEFAHAATIFKPMTGLMASRFTSSSAGTGTPSEASATDSESLLTGSRQRPADPAEEAAKLGMFGPLTRSSAHFYPSRLLCKRFDVPVPSHVAAENEGSTVTMPAMPASSATLTQPAPSSELSYFGSRFNSSGFQTGGSGKGTELLNKSDMEALSREAGIEPPAPEAKVEIEPDKNEALEAQRPGDEVFKAIFGEDSDSE